MARDKFAGAFSNPKANDFRRAQEENFSRAASTFYPPNLQIHPRRLVRMKFPSSPAKLEALNTLIHPKVFSEFQKAVHDAENRGVKILVKEAAILFESGSNTQLDVVIVVVADEQLRIERAVRKGMGSREEIKQRIARQWPQKKLIEKADYVVENNGSREELKKETEALYSRLLSAASSACNHL